MTTIPRRRSRAVATGLAAALALVLATGSPAGATINVTGGPTWSNNQVVTVSGNDSPATTATHYAMADCKLNPPLVPGSVCTIVSATPGLVALTTGTGTPPTLDTYSRNMTLDQAWTTSWDFTSGTPTSSTLAVDCDGATGDECGIVVSLYNVTGTTTTHLATETFDIVY